MRWILNILLLIILAAPLQSYVEEFTTKPKELVFAKNNKFFFLSSWKSHYIAADFWCKKHGLLLASPANDKAMNRMKDFLKGTNGESHWVGYTDLGTDQNLGSWYWYHDGSKSNYNNWDKDQPASKNNYRAAIAMKPNYKYHVDLVGETHFFICQARAYDPSI